MKKLFYVGIFLLIAFEILNVYFIMPMPGSQEMDSIDIAYFLHTYRWPLRIVFVLMIIGGCSSVFQSKRKWIPITLILITAGIAYLFNFPMAADSMFLQPHHVILKNKAENKLPESRLIIGVINNGEAKAYPIEFLAYHHQIQDTVGGKPVMVTYCSVCRTGRVYSPTVKGHFDKFRLVGMDHYNAMFEDVTTKSWWRQSTGEAITGEMKGERLPEIPSVQMTIHKWFELYPDGVVMQPDESFNKAYDTLARYEQGKSLSRLTRMDTISWNDKAWVIGIDLGKVSKAYDWNELKRERIINDKIGDAYVTIALAEDNQSFIAFERTSKLDFTINHDTLFSQNNFYTFSGTNLIDPAKKLKIINSYQEYWHSWKIFHPKTSRFTLSN